MRKISLKQRALGLVLLIITVWIIVTTQSATIAGITIPIGLYLVFTKTNSLLK